MRNLNFRLILEHGCLIVIFKYAHNWHDCTKPVFSFLSQLTTWHCSQLLLSAGRAAIDRYLLLARPTAAYPPHAAAAVDRWDKRADGRTEMDKRTDRRTPYRYIDPVTFCASSVLLSAQKSEVLWWMCFCGSACSRAYLWNYTPNLTNFMLVNYYTHMARFSSGGVVRLHVRHHIFPKWASCRYCYSYSDVNKPTD